MDERYIALAVPVFFITIVLELVWNLRRGDARYRLHDTLANLSCGLGQRVFGLALEVGTLFVYALVFKHLKLFTLDPSKWWTWVLALLATDLAYYSTHRASHRVNFLWAGHAVHHQSEEYNLSAALRQSWLEPVLSLAFYLPLAVLGFPPAVWVGAVTVNTLYQYWIHTRAIKTLGPLEWFLNTPSHHRVHHGIDPAYIDKNYGGMFCVWDRLFGTFEPEKREPYYGTVKPLASFSAYYGNAFEWLRIASLIKGAETTREKLYAPFAPPEWKPAAMGGLSVVPEVIPGEYARYDTRVAKSVDVYAVVQFALVTLVATALLWFHGDLSRTAGFAVGAWIMLGVASVGALIEGRAAGRITEWVRWASLPGVALLLAHEAHAITRARVTVTVLAALAGFAMQRWMNRATDGLSATVLRVPDGSRAVATDEGPVAAPPAA